MTRRDVLKLGGAAAVGMAAAGLDRTDAVKDVAAQGRSNWSILENGDGKFRIEIDGASVDDIHEVAIEPIVLEVLDKGVGEDGYRTYGPGDAHYGSITIRSRVGAGATALYQWWLDASRGQNIRKSISVICLKRDGSEARRFNCLECYPTRWDPGEYSPSSDVACETIVCKMGRVELA